MIIMLNYISQKLQIIYALIAVFVLCRIEDRSKKLHINYSVSGVATVSAVDKLELIEDVTDTYYTDPITGVISKRFAQGYYEKNNLLLNTSDNWEVDLNTFQATIPSVISPNKKIVLGRAEFLQSELYRPEQARIVMPDGTVILNPTQINNVLSGKEKLSKLLCAPKTQVGCCQDECSYDETFAIGI